MPNPVVGRDLDRVHSVIGHTNKFADATVVITGAAGFLGFYLTQYLVRSASALNLRRVIALDTFQFDRPRWLEDLSADLPGVLDVHAFDIARDCIEDIGGAADAAFVIHAASIASPTFYRQHPLTTIDANVWGLRRLLDCYREASTLRGLLFFSSSEIYGDPPPAQVPTDEEYPGHVACVGPRVCTTNRSDLVRHFAMCLRDRTVFLSRLRGPSTTSVPACASATGGFRRISPSASSRGATS